MTTVVESSADQVQAYTDGKGVFPIPPEVAADNARQAAKAEDPVTAAQKALEAEQAKPKVEIKPEPKAEDDDIEDERGLTPRQKREFSEAMLKTIAKKHRAQKEAEEFATAQFNQKALSDSRAEQLARENAELKARLAPPATVEEVKTPLREDYKNDQEFWDAMVDFRVDQKLKAAQAEAAKREEEKFFQEEAAHAQAKMDRALEQGPADFQEVFEGADIVLPNHINEAIHASDLMMELVYFLGNHRDQAEKIGAMTQGLKFGTPPYFRAAQRQLVEIGKIESTLSPFASKKANGAEDTKEPKPSTDGDKPSPETGSAPSKPRVNAPIIAPLTGGSAAQVSADEANLTGSQVTKIWQKKHGVQLTARKRH